MTRPLLSTDQSRCRDGIGCWKLPSYKLIFSWTQQGRCHSEEEFTSWCADVTLSLHYYNSLNFVIATQLSLTIVSFQTPLNLGAVIVSPGFALCRHLK